MCWSLNRRALFTGNAGLLSIRTSIPKQNIVPTHASGSAIGGITPFPVFKAARNDQGRPRRRRINVGARA